MIKLKNLIQESEDTNWNNWVASMVSTIEDYIAEERVKFTDVYTAYDYLKSCFRADAPSRDMFEKASKEAIRILINKGIVK